MNEKTIAIGLGFSILSGLTFAQKVEFALPDLAGSACPSRGSVTTNERRRISQSAIIIAGTNQSGFNATMISCAQSVEAELRSSRSISQLGQHNDLYASEVKRCIKNKRPDIVVNAVYFKTKDSCHAG
jgi:hypothetical protein